MADVIVPLVPGQNLRPINRDPVPAQPFVRGLNWTRGNAKRAPLTAKDQAAVLAAGQAARAAMNLAKEVNPTPPDLPPPEPVPRLAERPLTAIEQRQAAHEARVFQREL